MIVKHDRLPHSSTPKWRTKSGLRLWSLTVLTLVSAVTAPGSTTGQTNPLFEGDLFAQMPSQKPPASSLEEDVQRAREASHWIRVVFEKASHPKLAELVTQRLKEKWNPNLGYELVFGESRGPREEEATAGRITLSITTFASEMQFEDGPQTERFIWAVELIARKGRYDLATTWDDLHLSAEKRLPRQFRLGSKSPETFNRENMGQLYEDFKRQLEAVPYFAFFPQPDFDLVRPLFTYRPGVAGQAAPISGAGFMEEVTRLLAKQNPLYRAYLGRIAIELVRHGATDYVEGICTVFTDWNQQIHKEKIEVLRSNLGFANYQLIKCLIAHPQGQIVLRDIPEMKTNPALAALEQSFKQGSVPGFPGGAYYASAPAPQAASDQFKLQAIFFGTKPSAIIGGRTVFIGDVVAGFKVAKIEPQSVTLHSTNGQNKLLKLGGQ